MSWIDFFQKVDYQTQKFAQHLSPLQIGKQVFFQEKEEARTEPKIALIGLITDTTTEFESIRKEFYQLKKGNWNVPIFDFGNLLLSQKESDNAFAIKSILEELRKKNYTVILLSQEIHQALYQFESFENEQKPICFGGIDNQFLLETEPRELNQKNLLNHMIQSEKVYLDSYAHLGFQHFFSAQEELDFTEQIHFNTISLGELVQDITESEPFVRNLHSIYLNLNSLQYSGFHSSQNPTPNGFSSREICALTKYCGACSRLSSLFIGNYLEHNHPIDHLLLSEIIWYFVDGINHRPDEINWKDSSLYETYYVQLPEQELVFYKDKLSQKWWMRVEWEKEQKKIPCSQKDYQTALEGNLPNRWWKFYKSFY